MMSLYQLTDKSRLPEIYRLRVIAYEHSPKAQYVNRQRFPNGWFDRFDPLDDTLHWVIEDQGRIVAAARLAILYELSAIGTDLTAFAIPTERPFAYWSRLVVHADYRHGSAARQLDTARMMYLQGCPQIRFALCFATTERHKTILRLGFDHLGDVTYGFALENETMMTTEVQSVQGFYLKYNQHA